MRRIVVACVVGLLSMAPALPLAQEGSKKQDAPASKKTLSFSGLVSMVTTDSLTVIEKTDSPKVNPKAREMTFVIDKSTVVIGIGAGTKTADLKRRGRPTFITEFVRMGDTVVVSYHDTGTSMHAARVRVTKKSDL